MVIELVKNEEIYNIFDTEHRRKKKINIYMIRKNPKKSKSRELFIMIRIYCLRSRK